MLLHIDDYVTLDFLKKRIFIVQTRCLYWYLFKILKITIRCIRQLIHHIVPEPIPLHFLGFGF